MKRNHIPRKRKKLGEILVEQGRITPEQQTEFLRIHKESSKPYGQVLVEHGILTQNELSQILGEQLGIPHVWLRKGLVDPRIVHVLPKEKALLYQVIPMFCVNDTLTLAASDPHDIFVFDEVSKITEMEVQPVICRAGDIIDAINQSYQEDVSIDEIMSSIDDTEIEVVETPTDLEISEIAEISKGSPVINLTNLILVKSIRDGASDIHLELWPGNFRVRVRIDGVLYELMNPKVEMHPAVVSRLKVMAKLDISERRLPQDGRIQVKVDGRAIDLRFSSMPGVHGEKVVLRILDKGSAILDINRLGFDQDISERFKTMLRQAHGLILVSGPTGSGKTTTLYSAISMLNSLEKNIVTIEDPVEYQLTDINQNQVNEAIGLSFAKFLKHALRQDPDILLVGEIRDRETAKIAIQASLTGHLVLSTIHTNDSPSTITRMLEMGIEPFLLSSSMLGFMAQRLIRAICPDCKTGFYPSAEVLRELGLDETKPIRLFKGKGCPACYDSGHKGRFGIFELLETDGGLQHLILQNPTINALRRYLSDNGNETLRTYGYRKVKEGRTTMEEVKRTTTVGE